MATVKINDKDYEIDSLSETAKSNLISLKFVQDEIKKLEAQTSVYKTAEAAYSRVLNNELEAKNS